jgi:N-acetylmuramoyl-L-alanine amidase
MITRSVPIPRGGAIAVVLLSTIAGCASVPLAITPQDVLSTVIANLPATVPTEGGGSTTRRRRIPNSPPPSAAASRLLHTADSYRGVKYVWGGNTPGEGFDCSGFTKYVFAKSHVALPRTSREQARTGTAIPADFGSLRPGDLMFFAEPGEAISHVAIYAGDGVILHASSSLGHVGYTDLNSGGDWFVAYFVAARRVL